MNDNTYNSPFSNRYASDEMRVLFSNKSRHIMWRRLWLALAKSQKDLGVNISDEQIKQLEDNVENIDYNVVATYEEKFKHDVVAHLHAYCDSAPLARPILHLGATSQYVVDNADSWLMRQALSIIRTKLRRLILDLMEFARIWADQPCIGYTHFQPAQPTTIGKRAAMWLSGFMDDLDETTRRLHSIPFRGVKGTTGTQASYLRLFEDSKKVVELDRKVAAEFGFEPHPMLCSQTYDRKLDTFIGNVLTGIAISATKMCNDLRLLSHTGEVRERFDIDQIGSSAMPYKRNPILCEKIVSLSRFVVNACRNYIDTAMTQWLERTLDDSANRRLTIAESFLAVDEIMNSLKSLVRGLYVDVKVIKETMDKHVVFMMSENIMIDAVKNGADRQSIHESIRKCSLESGGDSNKMQDLLKREGIKCDYNVDEMVGRAAEQTHEYIKYYESDIMHR